MIPRRLFYPCLFLAALVCLTALQKHSTTSACESTLINARPATPRGQDTFSFPPLAQSGRPYVITGPFDGDASNTKVEVGGGRVPVITESTAGATIEIPSTVIGPNNVNVNENGKTATGSFRALKIDLTAPKTSLLKGESTELHIEVQGLQGITQPVPIQLQNQTPQNINLTGGNTQNIVINPSQVGTGGTFNWTTPITGTSAGGFNITATIPSTVGSQPTPSATPTPSPQTATGTQPAPSGSPSGQSTGNPNAGPIGATAADLKKKCDELRRQLAEAKGPCDRKTAECEKLAQQLEARRAEADRAQADYDKKKSEFDEALQNFLNNLIAAARANGVDTKLSLKQENKNYLPLKLADGVVIYFDASGIEGQQYIDNLANALKKLITGNLANQLNQLKAQAAALAKADAENKKAIAARKAAKEALDKCVAERDALCAKVRELESELAQCEREAADQAEAERKAKEEKEKANPPGPTGQPTGPANRPTPTPTPSPKPAQPAEDPVNKKLCEFCIKFMSAEGSTLTPEEANALQDLAESLGMLDDALENAKGPASLLPLLKKLSAALKAAQASAEAINQLNDVIKQIEKLGAGGNDPANMGKFLKLVGGILSKVKGGGPLLQGLAFFFNQLGDLFDAVAALGDALATFRQMKQINAELRKYSCPQLLGMFLTLLDKAKGDQDKALDDFIDSKFGPLVRNDTRLKEKVKQAILTKLRLCCLQKILKECPKKK